MLLAMLTHFMINTARVRAARAEPPAVELCPS